VPSRGISKGPGLGLKSAGVARAMALRFCSGVRSPKVLGLPVSGNALMVSS
jgi:hypothetical protein